MADANISYEYRVEHVPGDDGALEDALNALGADGWLLVATPDRPGGAAYQRVILYRPVKEE